jgi:predicted SprT family Zn-dependent metalloprotease
MNYTLQTISTAPSYEALTRNGFTDIDVLAYYGTPKEHRGTMFIQIKAEVQRKKFGAPKPKVNIYTPTENLGAQKCTSKANLDDVRQMAMEYMEKTWSYRGRTFNLDKLGGQCWGSRKKIYLSQWVVEGSEREMSGWINTMVHEIAHAINHIMGGRGHDWQWRDIFTSFGGSGERCSSDVTFGNLIEKPISKYTLVCNSCGSQSPSHKIKKRASACGKCCNEKNGGRYTSEFILEQIKNY